METETNTNGESLNNPDNQSTMPIQLIQEMVDNYRNNQLNFINNNLGITDSHSIWFCLDRVKEFIEQIENHAKQADPQCPDKDLGIRFYYAAYPEDSCDPIPEDYAKRHTLILIPTKKKEDGSGELLDFDFNPFENHCDTDKQSVLAITATAELGRSALAHNHGALIPPGTNIVESY